MSSLLRSSTARAAQVASGSRTSLVRAASTSSASSTSSVHPPTPKRRKGSSRKVRPIATTRALVDLHHTAASFMHSPEDIATGFENTFRNSTLNPYFQKFWQFRDSALEIAEVRESGTENALVERVDIGAKASTSKARAGQPKAPSFPLVFKKHEKNWSERGRMDEHTPELTERELQVKEALFGTWERGGAGIRRAEPSLEGIKEYLAAKGTTVTQAAEEWNKRHDED